MTAAAGAARAAAAHLEGERRDGFAEASHLMTFPRAAGLGGGSDVRVGEVFPRALVADALIDAREAGLPVDGAGIDEDVRRLVALRCEDVGGGWRYFPDLPELPPDADVLAAVLRVLARTGHPGVAELCDEPIRLALARSCGAPEGGFGTWIVDPGDAGARAVTLRRAIAALWGDTVDVEVVANLLHALVLHDPDRFRAAIAAGVGYAAGQQLPGGGWRSAWYRGELYGTFVCCRLTAAAAPGHPALARAAAMLAATQAGDGGWGRPEATPTDTALGLLAARACGRGGAPLPAPRLRRAVAFLLARQSPAPGRWPGDDFIEMDLNRVRTLAGAGEPRVVAYRSATVTSALCLQALCADA